MSIFCIVMILLLIVCVVGNSLVILAIYAIKALQVTSNRLLLGLAMEELAFGNVIFFKNAICRSSEVNNQTSMSDKMTFYFRSLVNSGTLVAIAYERYLAVQKPFYHKVHVNNCWFYKAYLFIYLLPTVLAAPGWYFSSIQKTNTAITTPSFNTSAISGNSTSHDEMYAILQAYEVAIVCLSTIVPAFIMSILYGRIIYRIWLKPGTQGSNTAILKARRKMTKLLLTVTVVFYLCWLPLLLYASKQISEEVERWLVLFPLLNTALNPIIYCLHSASFRQGLLRLLFCTGCCTKKSRCVEQNVVMTDRLSVSNSKHTKGSVLCLSVEDIKKD